MTGPLAAIVADWMNGRRDSAMQRYGIVAGYIDFAMQDLDTVIDVGRAVTARALGLNHSGSRRLASAREAETFERAIDFWFAQWREFQVSTNL